MKKPPVFPGIHPVGPCLERLFDKEFIALPRLMACECPKGLKQAAIDEHPRDMEARKFDVEVAACWELQRYGAILLATNPYSKVIQLPQSQARVKAVAA